MKLSAAILFVVSSFTLSLRGEFPAATEIFSLTISTIEDTVSAGSEIKLMIKLTNDTNHVIALVNRDQYCDYTVEVHDSNGQSAPETEKKRNLKCGDEVAGKRIVLKLKPGEHHEDLIFVNDLFDMTHPDKYTVRATREIPKELGQGKVKSNIITITVKE
jgi:hypothetical protein